MHRNILKVSKLQQLKCLVMGMDTRTISLVSETSTCMSLAKRGNMSVLLRECRQIRDKIVSQYKPTINVHSIVVVMDVRRVALHSFLELLLPTIVITQMLVEWFTSYPWKLRPAVKSSYCITNKIMLPLGERLAARLLDVVCYLSLMTPTRKWQEAAQGGDHSVS